MRTRSIFWQLFMMVCVLQSCGPKSASSESTLSIDEMKEQISAAFKKEQEVRKEMVSKIKAGETDTMLNNKMIKMDSVNRILAINFIETYGWPKISEVGKDVSYGIFYIIQHNDTETMKKYLPDLQARANSGEASKKHLAMMTDRVLMDENKKQIYGTQAAPRKDANGYVTNEYYIWPIKNQEKVNDLRRSMGFENTVEEYAANIEASYSQDETMIENNKE